MNVAAVAAVVLFGMIFPDPSSGVTLTDLPRVKIVLESFYLLGLATRDGHPELGYPPCRKRSAASRSATLETNA